MGQESIEIAGFTFGKIQIFTRTLLSGGDSVAEVQARARGGQGQGGAARRVTHCFSPPRLCRRNSRAPSPSSSMSSTPRRPVSPAVVMTPVRQAR